MKEMLHVRVTGIGTGLRKLLFALRQIDDELSVRTPEGDHQREISFVLTMPEEVSWDDMDEVRDALRRGTRLDQTP